MRDQFTDCSKRAKWLHHWIHLSLAADVPWWHTFLEAWNCRSMIRCKCFCQTSSPDSAIFPAASGAWGCGVFWLHYWLQWQWNQMWLTQQVAAKESVAILLWHVLSEATSGSRHVSQFWLSASSRGCPDQQTAGGQSRL